MHGRNSSEIHHPTMFISTGINTFQAPQMSFTNPVLQAINNRFIGDAKLTTLYDINRSNSSSYNLGLSFSSHYGFSPNSFLLLNFLHTKHIK